MRAAIDEPSTSTPTEFTTSQRLVQESIDQALADRAAVESPSTGTPPQLSDASVAAVLAGPSTNVRLPVHVQELDTLFGRSEFTMSQRLVQESIDEALAGRGAPVEFTMSQRLVQESIDGALAAQGVSGSYTPVCKVTGPC